MRRFLCGDFAPCGFTRTQNIGENLGQEILGEDGTFPDFSNGWRAQVGN